MDEVWSEGIVTMIREDPVLLSRSLNAIPTEIITSRSSMLVLRDISHIAAVDTDAAGRRATLRAFADACTRLVNHEWDTIELNELLTLATGYLIELRLLGRLQESVVFGDRVYARARTLSAKQQINKGRFSWFHVHRGTTLMLLGDDAGAIVSYRRAWEYATGAGADFIQAQAAANLALTYALGGDSAKAKEWLGRHRSLDTSDWPGTYVCGIGAHVAAGLLALDRLDEETARSEVEYLGDGSMALELWSFIAYLHAQFDLYYGDAAEALAQLEQVQARSDGADMAKQGATGALLSRATADLLIACGRGEKTRQLIRSQAPRQPWSRVPAARIRVLGGPGSGIEPDSVTWDPATSTRDRLEMLLLRAVESLRNGDLPDAARLADQALDLSGEVGILRPFAAIAAEERAQLLELTGREMEPGDAQILARRPPVYPARLVFVELSDHEQSVLEALSHDGSRQAIAASLFVSVNTIKSQLASIFRKLGTTTRSDTLAKARELELLPPAIPG
jgi:LuxR family maltose regulon positive regulatory protein